MVNIVFYIVFCLITFLCISIISYFFNNKRNKKEHKSKTSLDYWYTHPHYVFLPSGKKIDISKYLTYEEYVNMSKEKLMVFLYRLDENFKKENNIME